MRLPGCYSSRAEKAKAVVSSSSSSSSSSRGALPNKSGNILDRLRTSFERTVEKVIRDAAPEKKGIPKSEAWKEEARNFARSFGERVFTALIGLTREEIVPVKYEDLDKELATKVAALDKEVDALAELVKEKRATVPAMLAKALEEQCAALEELDEDEDGSTRRKSYPLSPGTPLVDGKAFTALDNAISDIRENIESLRERVPETIERSNATLGAVERTTERLQTETGTVVATTGIDDDDDDYYFDDTNEEGADAGTVLAKRIITSLAGVERSQRKKIKWASSPEDGEGDSNVEGDGDNDGDDNGDGPKHTVTKMKMRKRMSLSKGRK